MKKKGESLIGGSKIKLDTLVGVRGGQGAGIIGSGAAGLSTPVTGIPGLVGGQ
jgi:hypothetical protein